eukprot:SRR837773.5839.p4 GENE.SRR837773.5839~~SRR837773.5839.p4  ORF type:complete len:131 (+),score=25.72 SRR837773.5839:368-760(+)
MPQPLPGEVPQNGAHLADLVHQAHADGLFGIVQGKHLHAAQIDSPRRCFPQQRQDPSWMAEDEGRVTKSQGTRETLEIFKWICRGNIRLGIRWYALELHLAAGTLEALKTSRVHTADDIEVLLKVASAAG